MLPAANGTAKSRAYSTLWAGSLSSPPLSRSGYREKASPDE